MAAFSPSDSLLFRYVMAIRGFLNFFHGCVLQRLHCRFLLSHPINAASICNDVQPSRKLVGILECRKFRVCLEEGVLRNLFGIVKVADLPPHKGMDAFLILLN